MSDIDLSSILSFDSTKQSKDGNSSTKSSNSIVSPFSRTSSLLNNNNKKAQASGQISSGILSSSDLKINISGSEKNTKKSENKSDDDLDGIFSSSSLNKSDRKKETKNEKSKKNEKK